MARPSLDGDRQRESVAAPVGGNGSLERCACAVPDFGLEPARIRAAVRTLPLRMPSHSSPASRDPMGEGRPSPRSPRQSPVLASNRRISSSSAKRYGSGPDRESVGGPRPAARERLGERAEDADALRRVPHREAHAAARPQHAVQLRRRPFRIREVVEHEPCRPPRRSRSPERAAPRRPPARTPAQGGAGAPPRPSPRPDRPPTGRAPRPAATAAVAPVPPVPGRATRVPRPTPAASSNGLDHRRADAAGQAIVAVGVGAPQPAASKALNASASTSPLTARSSSSPRRARGTQKPASRAHVRSAGSG